MKHPYRWLAPWSKKTHQAYVWAYTTIASTDTQAVVYDFSPSHARTFLQDWRGQLVCDYFGGYKASFALGVTEIGCMAHTRRKFYELHAINKSILAEQALQYIAAVADSTRGFVAQWKTRCCADEFDPVGQAQRG